MTTDMHRPADPCAIIAADPMNPSLGARSGRRLAGCTLDRRSDKSLIAARYRGGLPANGQPPLPGNRIEMQIIKPVRGTRDFYPEDMAFQRWLYARIREASTAFGYQEYDGPFLERLELYAAKSGEELVKEQSYVFEDRSGETIALRPELTPSLARMVAARSKSLPRMLRWWSFGPFWRYERTQRGRSREFFQWNIDLIGVPGPQADAEIVAVGASFFRSLGLSADQIQIRVNNRKLAEERLTAIGIERSHLPNIFHLIDRIDRMEPEAWAAYARSLDMTASQVEQLKAILADDQAWQQSAELVAFFNAAEALGVREYLAFDATVIRGLDYYTGTVYEARDAQGRFRAVLGGGRYDGLVAAVGGDPIPATGFAMGDMVIALVLEAYGLTPEINPNPAQILVTTFADETMTNSMQFASQLRRSGIQVEWYPQADRLPKQLKYADRQRIPLAAILGPDEIAADKVAVKDLRTGQQQVIPQQDALGKIRALLELDH